MAEPDLSALSSAERATYWTGVVVRNDALLTVTMRGLLRDLHRGHPADPVPDEPDAFDELGARVRALVSSRIEEDVAGDILEAIDRAGSVHADGRALVDELWGALLDSDAFQVLDLFPDGVGDRAPFRESAADELEALSHRQVGAFRQLGGAVKVVRHQSYVAPFDTEHDRATRLEQVRGEG